MAKNEMILYQFCLLVRRLVQNDLIILLIVINYGARILNIKLLGRNILHVLANGSDG